MERLCFKVNIHENADVTAATEYWLGVTGATKDQFRKPVLKRHNPNSVRLKSGEHYQGALTIYVRRSSKLYRQIEGWARAIMLGSAEARTEIETVDEPPW